MKRGYWLYTIIRNGTYQTIVDFHSNPINFLVIERELGHKTFIVNRLEITKEEYDFWQSNK